MPFTFKPDTEAQAGEAAPAAPPAFGMQVQPGLPSMGLMQRAQDSEKSYFQMVLFGILGVTVAIALGMAAYMYYLNSQIEEKRATLSDYESSLQGMPLDDMRNMSNRIKAINQVVKRHTFADVAFKIIEDSVENPITYTKFALSYSLSKQSYSLALYATAPSYKAVVQQLDTLKRAPYSNYIHDLKLDGVGLDDKGNVNFNLSTSLSIMGLMPDQLNLTDGKAAEVAAIGTTTQATSSATTTQP